MHSNHQLIRPRDRDQVVNALRSGATPRIGFKYIQVGRAKELESIVSNVESIASGGTCFRLIIGEFGSGKSFFLNLSRAIAIEMGLVCIYADLGPNRRLQSSNGQARSLYTELMKNLSTRNKIEGGALKSIVEKFITEAQKQADIKNISINDVIDERLDELSDLVNGYDFAKVIKLYYQSYLNDDIDLANNCLKWLRGEYVNKLEARIHLNVFNIITDENIYDHIKLMSLFVKQAGYKGLLVTLDEMVSLYKLSSTRARLINYEQILRILNDCLQGSASSLGFLLGGTPEFLTDERRGLYSYEALKSRLKENSFAIQTGLTDFTSITLRLESLNQTDLYVLLEKLRHLFAYGDESKYIIDNEAIKSFLVHCSSVIGDAYFRTPRNTIRAFLDFLSILEQNKTLVWSDLIKKLPPIEKEQSSDLVILNDDDSDEFTDIRL